MARKTQPYVCDMSVHASVFYISYLVFSSTFADNSPYLNRIGVSPKNPFYLFRRRRRRVTNEPVIVT